MALGLCWLLRFHKFIKDAYQGRDHVAMLKVWGSMKTTAITAMTTTGSHTKGAHQPRRHGRLSHVQVAQPKSKWKNCFLMLSRCHAIILDATGYTSVSAWIGLQVHCTSDSRNATKFMPPTWVVCAPLSNMVSHQTMQYVGGGCLTLRFHRVFCILERKGKQFTHPTQRRAA